MKNFYQFADGTAYGSGAYDSSSYQTTSSGNLSYTGNDILIPLAIGIVLVVGSIIVIVKMLRSNRLDNERS